MRTDEYAATVAADLSIRLAAPDQAAVSDISSLAADLMWLSGFMHTEGSDELTVDLHGRALEILIERLHRLGTSNVAGSMAEKCAALGIDIQDQFSALADPRGCA